MIRLELPLAPSVNRLWRTTKTGGMYRSKVYTDWLEEAGWMIKQQTKDMIFGEYILHVAAVKPDKRHRDLDNLLKATSDLLVKMHIIQTDSACRGIAAEWVEDGPPMTVTVYKMNEESLKWNTKLMMN
jgi:Holliday junction resolvase RusA-like endonuclease